MTPKDKLKEIENKIDHKTYVMSCYSTSGALYNDMLNDIKWLLSRVKQLENVINKLCIIQSGHMDYTNDFYELCKVELRSVLKEMPE